MKILLYNEINQTTAQDVTEKILNTEQSETIDIWLNSPGGSLTSGWAMIAAIQQHKGDKNITVVGDASSMAFIMLAFADKVTAYDTSNFLIHRAASWWESEMTKEELKDIEQRNKLIRAKLEQRINVVEFEQITGVTFNDIFSMSDRLDVRLTASQAKKIGIVDTVIKLDPKKREQIEMSTPDKILNSHTPHF